jgi:hypothetical protein
LAGEVDMKIGIEIDREDDRRWIAEANCISESASALVVGVPKMGALIQRIEIALWYSHPEMFLSRSRRWRKIAILR